MKYIEPPVRAQRKKKKKKEPESNQVARSNYHFTGKMGDRETC